MTAVTEDGAVDSEQINVNITDEEKEQRLALGEYTVLNVELKRSVLFGLLSFYYLYSINPAFCIFSVASHYVFMLCF